MSYARVTCAHMRLREPSLRVQAGHALAAAAEGVGLHHLAAFTVLLLPGAYVALDTETLQVLSPWRALRVRLALHLGSGWHKGCQS